MFKTVRWKIGLLMLLGVAINYLDRVNISHAVITITKEFGLTNIEKGYILSAFSFGYVLFMMIGGFITYKFGAKISLFFSGVLLSLSSIFSGFSTGYYSLLLSRFFIGVFEAPTFPGNAYIVSKWFPKNERAKATGLFDTGSYIGAAFAAPVIIYLIIEYDWRTCFIVSGVVGIVWSIVWYFFYYDDPSKHPKITSQEMTLLELEDATHKIKIPWKKYFYNKSILGMSIGFFCYNYLKNFHLTWFPTYLIETKGMSFIKLSFAGFIPPIAAIIGELYTGYLIDKFIITGKRSLYVKKISISIGLILSSVIILSLFFQSTTVVILFISLSYMFLISASVGIWSMPDEIVENKNMIPIIGSIQNTFSNSAGIIAPIVTGYIYEQTHSFFIPFIISCILSVIGAASYWFMIPDSKVKI